MNPRSMLMIAAGAAALAVPAAGLAQAYGGGYPPSPYYNQGGDYGQRGADYGWRYRGFRGYPQFRGLESHIRSEIQEGLREDTLDREGADDLLAQLQQIRYDEMREFRHHGWNLPYDDQMRIRDALQQLDQQVDRTRAEP